MIVLGRIVAPFGVRAGSGFILSGMTAVVEEDAAMVVGSDPDGEVWVPYTLKGARSMARVASLHFAEVPDRNGAEAVDGYYIAAPREALPKPDADEYYWGDLVGLEVRNASGVVLGKVSGLMSTGAHDVLQVQDGDTERLIPFVASYVTAVDIDGGVSRRMGSGLVTAGAARPTMSSLFPEMFSALRLRHYGGLGSAAL
jgi:16S rRNA processing protein RimM